MNGLLDSGAEVSVIGTDLAPRLSPGVAPRIRGVGDALVKTLGWGEIDIVLADGAQKTVKGLVLPGDGLILGMPFLTGERATIYLELGMAMIGDSAYQLEAGSPSAAGKAVGSLNIYDVVPQADAGEPKMPVSDLSAPNPFEGTIFSAGATETIKGWLTRYDRLFSDTMGTTDLVEHEIIFEAPTACNDRLRRYSDSQKIIIEKELDKMLAEGVIRPSKSPFASAVVLVKKKGGDWRFCIDYRRLNKHTKKDQYPLPFMRDLIHGVKHARFFVALDLRAGYWQIPMARSSVEKTAFRTHRGLYEFTVMPFGLVNAPATFQRFMDQLLGDLYSQGISCYLDDVLIASETEEDCLRLLKEVLARLDDAGCRVKLSKCQFGPSSLTYLGFLLSKGSLKPLEEKVRAIEELMSPRCQRELRSALGLLGFYRIFIPDFGNIAAPLNELLKKNVPFTWGKDHETAFRKLTKALAARSLATPLDTDEMQITTDASDYGIGAVLEVKRDGLWQPVEYLSHSLSGAEKRWATREKEAYAIIYALKKFDCYVRGRKCRVVTDHKSLEWLLAAKTGKIARWASLLSEYDIDIHHCSGKLLEHVDALSRMRPDVEVEDRMVFTMNLVAPLPDLAELRRASEEDPPPAGFTGGKHEGLWWKGGRVWVPTRCRAQLLRHYHGDARKGHQGVRRTKANLRQLYFWPGMSEDVEKLIARCLACQRRRVGVERLQGTLTAHRSDRPLESLHLDLWGPIEDDEGQKWWVLTMIDQYTRWVEAVWVSSVTSETVTSYFYQTWIARFGVPSRVMTDNGGAFVGKEFKELLLLLNVTHRTTPTHNSVSNSPIESWHRILVKQLPISLGKARPAEGKLRESLASVLLAYRGCHHSGLESSPAMALFGVELKAPIERELENIRSDGNRARLAFFATGRARQHGENKRKADVRNNRINQKRRRLDVDIGSLVVFREHGKSKLEPPWGLPMRIIGIKPSTKSVVGISIGEGVRQEAHFEDVRKLEPPRTREELRQWYEELKEEGIEAKDLLKFVMEHRWSRIPAGQGPTEPESPHTES